MNLKNNHLSHSSQRGDVSIYIALLVVTILTSTAIAMTGIVGKQSKYAAKVVNSERAFYAADSGIEAVLYQLKTKISTEDTTPSSAQESIDYQGAVAEFTATGALATSADQTRTLACVDSNGKFGSEARRLSIGGDGCTVEP